MTYLIAIIVFFLTIVFGVSCSVLGVYGTVLLWNIPSIVLILIPAVGISITASPLKGAGLFKTVFGNASTHDQGDVVKVFRFLRTLGNSALIMGVIAFFISQILMLADLSNPNTIGPNMAIGLISILYAVMLKLIAYSAQCKVRTKGEIPHDMLNRDVRVWIAYLFVIMPLLNFFILLFAMSPVC